MKKLGIPLLILVNLFLSSCSDPAEEIQFNGDAATSAAGVKTHVRNPRFEQPTDFNNPKKNVTWIKQAWMQSVGTVTWAKGLGVKGSGGVSIEIPIGPMNDIAITQTVVVDPTKMYKLKAWVKTENVQGGAGANVGIFNTWTHSDPVWGTTDWHEISVEFIPPASGEVTIACRMGYWSGVTTGKAFFDNVTIVESTRFVKTGEHVRLVLDEEDAAVVEDATIESWVSNLDLAYEKYYELMGQYPYYGEMITIMSVNQYPGGWAVAGNPILWYKPYIQSSLLDIQSTGDWSFGILHELGHDFGLQNVNRNWVWHEEMFANFRMYYVVDKLNAAIYLDHQVYKGTELERFFKTDNGQSYDKTIARGIAIGENGIMYTLIRIKNQIGWEPFIEAYKDLNGSTVSPGNDWERFNLLLDKLTYYSSYDVRSTYLPGELDTIKQIVLSD